MDRRLLPVVVATLLVGACGEEALSRSELISQADAICSRADKAIDALGTPDTAKELQTLADKSVEITDEAIADLKELEAPEEVKADYEKAISNLEKQRDLVDQLGKNASNEAKLTELVKEGERLSDENGKIAKRIGLKECGGD